MSKQYRFFYHYNKQNRGMTVHFRGQCLPCVHVKCDVPCETKYSAHQPVLVMRGFAKRCDMIGDDTIRIQ